MKNSPPAPTPEQSAILTAASRPESLMVHALAGTGKTTTLVMLAGALPRQPSLALAFNVKIKKELEKRFPAHFSVLTLNGLGHRAWASLLGKRLVIDERKLGRLVTEALRNTKATPDVWAGVRQLVVLAMQSGLVPSRYTNFRGLVEDTPRTWEELSDDNFLDLSPDERKIARAVLCASIDESFAGTISFDDQIYAPTMLGGQFPRFPIVLVDEAQDLSPLNHIMLRKCCAGRLIVVGDPHQAIYAFRGADSESMGNIKALRPEWIDLPLSQTFRCPQAIVERQLSHVPLYRAAESNPQGVVKRLEEWSSVTLLQCPAPVAVLCRNNAPLLTLAFKLLRESVPVAMLGRDIGKGLAAIVKKLCPDATAPITAVRDAVLQWQASESQLAIANGREEKLDGITDRAECIYAVIDGASPATCGALCEAIAALFARDRGRVTLSSIHRAKGLEWETVLHLDPWRIPSKQAKAAFARGDDAPLRQEHNLRYVAETRTKHTLLLADISNFTGAST